MKGTCNNKLELGIIWLQLYALHCYYLGMSTNRKQFLG